MSAVASPTSWTEYDRAATSQKRKPAPMEKILPKLKKAEL
jgi:hypothetical protein